MGSKTGLMKKYPVFGYATKRFNPLTGCSANCSVGGKNYCWARPMAHRLKAMGVPAYQLDDPFRPTFHPERLCEPEKWRNPQVVACNFMGDWMDFGHVASSPGKVLKAINDNPRHTFLTLTKQARLLDSYVRGYLLWDTFKLPDNIWLGLSITNQQDADEKLPIFLQIPGKKWLSIEPCVGEIDIGDWLYDMSNQCGNRHEEGYCNTCTHKSNCNTGKIDQVILGGMSGNRAKDNPMKLEWAERIVSDCQAAGVPVFVKQLHLECPKCEGWGRVRGVGRSRTLTISELAESCPLCHGRKFVISKDPAEWPESLRVRQLAWGEK